MSGPNGMRLNCSLAVPTAAPAPDTPNTPEILNAIINISSDHLKRFTHEASDSGGPDFKTEEPAAPSPVSLDCVTGAPSPPPAYTACCHEPAQYSASPMQHSGTVQQYHTQFVKEGLKLKVKQKIKEEPEEAAEQRRQGVQADLGNLPIKQENEDLTLEDEERRRRRRERNKVAATKCRNKKKERTTLLIAEGEVLEIQNVSLTEELRRLKAEKRRLTEILRSHQPACRKKQKNRKRKTDGRKTHGGR